MKLRPYFLGLLCFGLVWLMISGRPGLTVRAAVPSLPRVRDIKTIQVIVRQTFGEADPKSISFFRTAQKVLESKGFRIVDDNAVQYDAQLLVDAEGSASSGRYQGGLQYSGAQISGNLTLNRDGVPIWTGTFEGNVPPAEVITKRFKRPSDAPFEKAFEESGFELIIRSLAYFLGDDASLREIVDALDDRRAVIRSRALEILSIVRAPKTLPAVLAKLRDTDPKVRLTAVKTLSFYEHDETFSSVLSMLADEDINVRREAACVLGQIRDSRAVPSLIKLLKTDAFVRVTVKDSLLRIGEPSVEPLISLLQDMSINPLAREEAVEVLGELKDRRAVVALMHSLESNDHWEQKEAVEALCTIGRDTVAPLIGALNDSKPILRQCAAEILGRLKAHEAQSALLDRLKDTDPAVRAQAAWALGELGDLATVQPLESLALNDPDENVRQKAGEAVIKIRRNSTD